ncbi:MAG: hemolysin family protein [bacterium]
MTGRQFFILIFLGLIGSFLFSGIESGILAVDLLDLRRLSKAGSKKATGLLILLERKDLILASLLIAHNIANVTLSAMTTAYFNKTIGHQAPLIAVIVITPVILICGEFLPKMLFLTYSNRLLLKMHRLIQLTTWMLYPFAVVAISLPRWMSRHQKKRSNDLTRHDIQVLVKTGAGSHQITQEERVMLGRLLEMKDRRVVKAMVPISDVIMIPDTASIQDALYEIRKHGVSRLPVYHEINDNIIGIVNAIDLLKAPFLQESIRSYIQKPFFVPEQTVMVHLLAEAYKKHEISVVIDEYGVATGIIAMEDMIEEITGDIVDEYDKETSTAHKLREGTYIVDSRISIKSFNETIAPILPSGDYQTLAGFINQWAQKIPQAGDTIGFENIQFMVLDATPKKLGKLIVHIDPVD